MLASEITADGDYSHEIKTLAPGRKAMTNLDSILKSRDITFPTKVRLVKAEKAMAPTPVLLPGESQGQGNLVGCRLWGFIESDTTEVT